MVRSPAPLAVAAGLALLGSLAPLGAEGAPELPGAGEEMVKVVYRGESASLAPDHPDNRPKTLYRVGERWGRLEHPEIPALHPLVIVASPDIWFVDLETKSARHSLDPGPRFAFRAPIVSRKLPDMPDEIFELEFGRELEFLEARGAKRRAGETRGGEKVDFYETEFADARIVASTIPNTRELRSIIVLRKGQILAAYVYEEYERGLAADPALFTLPDGIEVVEEAGVEGAAQPKAPPEKKKSEN